ncbi:MAG: cell division transport system permease protein [Cellvibrionaceae bacterium]
MNQRTKSSTTATAVKVSDSKMRGAKTREISAVQLFRSWWHHHRISCIDSLARLLATPLQSLLTSMVIAIALALPTLLYLGLENVQRLDQSWQDNAQMSVFIKYGARSNAIDRLVERWQSDSTIAAIDRITPGAALAEFEQYSGLGDVLQEFEENPLPNVLMIQPTSATDTPQKLVELQTRLQADPLVDKVQLDMGWLQRLHELLTLGERLVVALGILLSLGVLLVIGNTLRLTIENRREEIVVTKMVGGTNGFIRRPFLYTGVWYGLGGGLLAILLLLLVGQWLSSPLDKLINLYESNHSLSGLHLETSLVLLSGSGFLGWLGAWLAVSRHLQAIEPR